MYCPICFSNNLFMTSRGSIHFLINGKKTETGQILFNFQKENQDQIKANILKKIKELIQWYSGFQNKKDEVSILVYSGDFLCKLNNCSIPLNAGISVIEALVGGHQHLKQELTDLGSQFDLKIILQNSLND